MTYKEQEPGSEMVQIMTIILAKPFFFASGKIALSTGRDAGLHWLMDRARWIFKHHPFRRYFGNVAFLICAAKMVQIFAGKPDSLFICRVITVSKLMDMSALLWTFHYRVTIKSIVFASPLKLALRLKQIRVLKERPDFTCVLRK